VDFLWVGNHPGLDLCNRQLVLPALHLDRSRVRRCAGATCVLLFHDTSKTGRRRWCDMAACGNRAKSAAHHARRQRPG
jgi:predicted RNA-binding Zn ribbon-like protein